MSTLKDDAVPTSHCLRTYRVLRVDEHACEVWSEVGTRSIRFAPMFPSPRAKRVSPGHLVAFATGPNGDEVVVWRWFDAVVLGREPDGSIRLWEPSHGEVIAQPRASWEPCDPGSRVYASAGLPGSEWWVAASADADPWTVEVELDAVDKLYTENHLWPTVFAPNG
jgi:hypothetical protein